MQIEKAKYLGFCFGVKNAVDLAQKAVEDSYCNGSFVYACGPIIHNKHVIGELKTKGLITVDNLDEIPFGSFVIVRSHGESKSFFDLATQKGLAVIDATCPKVKKIQQIVSDADAAGDVVIIIGNKDHPEVEGINGWCDNKAKIVSTIEDAKIIISEFDENTHFSIVSQTTFDLDAFLEIEKIFSKYQNIKINNTICSATQNRQEAAKELAEKVDAMLVIGDKNSSNTQKLLDIAKKRCKNTFFIENFNDLPLQDILECNRIGITAGASTPEGIIKEVITIMNEFNNDSNEYNPMNDYLDDIEKALKLPRNGDVITGEVIQVSEKDVIVNIGCKKDGVIPRSEVTLEPEQTLLDVFKEGDEVQAKVLKNDDGDGNILLSKKRVIVSEHWEDINKASEDKTTLEVTVIKEVNGGVIASFNEINGFIPMSQLSDSYVENAAEFVGKTLTVKVMRVDQKRNKVVFSHKAVLTEERQKRMMEIWDTINVGDDIDGKVMRFTDYGAFVDIGGIDGLLHISEISWGKLRHPEEVLDINQEIKVRVLSMNKEKEKISLGYKQNLPEPWSVINEKYSIGQVIEGKAVQLKDYGVFVELEPGLDGLVHISEIAYRRVNNISDEIEVGQILTAKILEIDQDRKRISLSIKETLDKEAELAKEAENESIADKVMDSMKDEEEAPVEEAPVEEAPAEEAPAEEAPVEEAPAEEAPVEEAPAEEAPVEEAPAEEAPAEEAPEATEE